LGASTGRVAGEGAKRAPSLPQQYAHGVVAIVGCHDVEPPVGVHHRSAWARLAPAPGRPRPGRWPAAAPGGPGHRTRPGCRPGPWAGQTVGWNTVVNQQGRGGSVRVVVALVENAEVVAANLEQDVVGAGARIKHAQRRGKRDLYVSIGPVHGRRQVHHAHADVAGPKLGV
nr:hypothetical protein [Tanacetum cinerariifolium]